MATINLLTSKRLKDICKYILLLSWVLIGTGTVFSQKYTSISFLFDNNSNSFWKTSNQSGLADDGSYILISTINQKKSFMNYGLSIAGNKNNMQIPLGYVDFNLKYFSLLMGRQESQISNESDLSSGSLIRSQNAIPIPQISVYKPTFSKLEQFPIDLWYKWGIAHGQLSKRGYLKAPFLHEKYVYIKKPFNETSFLSVGVIHEAMWGGETVNHGKQPSSVIDYLRVVTFQSASKSALEQEQINALGNHLGIWDISFSRKYETTQLKLYYQHPFEDRSSMYQHFFDEIKQLKIPTKSFDGLFGIEITNKYSSIFSKFLYEYLNTMHQSGAEAASDSTYGWDNYYNHYIYQSGWTYERRVIGSPLFTLGKNKGHYSDGTYIINNRIRAHHLGISGQISPAVGYKTLLTYSKNYGTYVDADKFKSMNKPYPFEGGIKQFSGLIQLDFNSIWNNTNGTISYAFDRGDLYPDSDSFLFSISYQFPHLSPSH